MDYVICVCIHMYIYLHIKHVSDHKFRLVVISGEEGGIGKRLGSLIFRN